MSKFKWLAAVVWCLISAQPTFADEREKVIGIWKLVSQEIEIQATGQKEPVMGHSPTGYAIFTAEGRVMFVLTAEGRLLALSLSLPRTTAVVRQSPLAMAASCHQVGARQDLHRDCAAPKLVGPRRPLAVGRIRLQAGLDD